MISKRWCLCRKDICQVRQYFLSICLNSYWLCWQFAWRNKSLSVLMKYKLCGLLLILSQTPSMHHCFHNCSSYNGYKFIYQSKICISQSKLMIMGLGYVARPELLKSKHQIFVEVLTVKSCQCYLLSCAGYVHMQYSSFVFGIPPVITCELTTAVPIRFHFAGHNVIWSTVVHWTVTDILVSQWILLQHLKFPVMGYKPCWHAPHIKHGGCVCI